MSSAGISAGDDGFHIPTPNRKITHRDELLEHLISDEELTMLQGTNQDNVVQIFWGSLGAALGAAAPAIQELSSLGSVNFTWLSLIECGVFLVGSAIAVLMGIFWFSRHKKAEDLATKIRNRTSASNASIEQPVASNP